MDARPTWTDCDEAGDYVVPNVLSPKDLVFRPDNMDETVPHTYSKHFFLENINGMIVKLYIPIYKISLYFLFLNCCCSFLLLWRLRFLIIKINI